MRMNERNPTYSSASYGYFYGSPYNFYRTSHLRFDPTRNRELTSPPAYRAPSQKTEQLIEPHENDVLMGRGGNNSLHSGNAKLRNLARDICQRYMSSTKKAKSQISRDLVAAVHAMNPPGRFLKQQHNLNEWEEVDDERAREKCSQCLRDAVSEIRYEPSQDETAWEDNESELRLNEPTFQPTLDGNSVSSHEPSSKNKLGPSTTKKRPPIECYQSQPRRNYLPFERSTIVSSSTEMQRHQQLEDPNVVAIVSEHDAYDDFALFREDELEYDTTVLDIKGKMIDESDEFDSEFF